MIFVNISQNLNKSALKICFISQASVHSLWHSMYAMDRVKRIWYLSPMRAAKVQASLRIRAVSPEPSLLAHTSSESRGTFRQKARSLAPLNGWACAVKICHDGMLEDIHSLDAAQIQSIIGYTFFIMYNTAYTRHYAYFSRYSIMATNPFPSSHIPMGQNFLFSCF